MSSATLPSPVGPPQGAPGAASLGVHLVRLSGELDMSTAGACLRSCVFNDDEEVVVDMSMVTFMDSAGYRNLIAVRRAVEARGATMRMANTHGSPARLLRLLGGLGGLDEPADAGAGVSESGG